MKWFQSDFHILSGIQQLLEHLLEYIISVHQRLIQKNFTRALLSTDRIKCNDKEIKAK